MTTYNDSPITTYSDTTPQKKVITDVISLISPSDAPLIERLGGLDGAAGKFRFSAEGTNPQWLEDSLPGLIGAMTGGTISSTATSMTVSDASLFQVGHILQVDSQEFWVSAVNLSTDVLTISSLGGTAASHASTSVVTIVGMARLDGADSSPRSFTSIATGSNYTQIFHGEVKVADTMLAISQWGISDEFDYQASKVIPGLMREIESHILKTLAGPAAGSATAPRVMGGLYTYISSNTTTGTTLTKTMFENAVKLSYADGGVGPWVAPLSPTNFGLIRGFYETSSWVQIDRQDAVVGMPPVQRILTPFGEIEPLLDRWAPDGTIFMIDPNHAGMKTLRPFTQVPLSKDGDATKGEVTGEFTLCVRQNEAHCRLTSVSA